MANIITFEKCEERIWRYSYYILVNKEYGGYIGKTKDKNSKPFAYSSIYNIDIKADTFNELKKLVRQKIKEKLDEGNGL